MMNHKITEVCDIFIHCEVTLKMQTADSEKAFFYDYVKNVEVKMADIISILSIFITEKIKNKLIFEYF